MSSSEMTRLSQALARDAGLRARLAPALDPGADPAMAAGMLQAAGYRIAETDLPLRLGIQPLDDSVLGGVSGGNYTMRNFKSPFEDD